MMGLFSFLGETGRGCTAVIGEDKLLVEVKSTYVQEPSVLRL